MLLELLLAPVLLFDAIPDLMVEALPLLLLADGEDVIVRDGDCEMLEGTHVNGDMEIDFFLSRDLFMALDVFFPLYAHCS